MEVIGKYKNKILIKCEGGHYHPYPITTSGSFFCEHEGTTNFDYLNVNNLVEITNPNLINFVVKLTEEQLIAIYHIVFSEVHSDGFMAAEVKDLLFVSDYWFLQRPKSNGWYDDVVEYLEGIGFDTKNLNVNPALIL